MARIHISECVYGVDYYVGCKEWESPVLTDPTTNISIIDAKGNFFGGTGTGEWIATCPESLSVHDSPGYFYMRVQQIHMLKWRVLEIVSYDDEIIAF